MDEELQAEFVEHELEEGDDDPFSKMVLLVRLNSGIMIVCAVVGICANLYVVCATSASVKGNIVNRYVLLRALSDLLFLLSVPFLSAQGLLESWPFGDAMCKLTVGSVHGAAFLSSCLLIAMNADGYKAFNGYSYEERLRAFKVSSVASALLVAAVTVPFFVVFGAIEIMPSVVVCTITAMYMFGIANAINVCGLLFVLVTCISCAALIAFAFPPDAQLRDREVDADAFVARRLVLVLTVASLVLQATFALPRLVPLFVPFSLALMDAINLTAFFPHFNAALNPVVYIAMRRSLMAPTTRSYNRGIEITYVNLTHDL